MRIPLFAACFASFSACSAAHLAPDAGTQPDVAVASDAPAAVTDAPAMPPPIDAGADTICPAPGASISEELRELHAALILPGCVGSGRFCHGESHAFHMLTPEETRENLVGVMGCAAVRVVPCRPEESYVSHVVREGGEPCGRPTPVFESHPTFSADEIAAIESWIRGGAR